MGRFDVYRLGTTSLVVDVQADLLPPMKTRLVIPLAPADVGPRGIDALNPRVKIIDDGYVLVTQQMSAIYSHSLGERVASLTHEADRIGRAIDYILYGF